jgi:1-acyl-sn-glycerol-3-phosphate acyltransferase
MWPTIFRPFAWVALHIAYFIYGGIRFEGRDNVPRRGGVLIAPNHISDADPTAIALALPRACWYMAKEELFNMRVLGTLIRWLRGFPVKRYTADRAALRRAEELLKQGWAVVIFPEGKISETGILQPILPGALLAAQRADVPIVPTIIEGADRLIPYGETKPRRVARPIVVRFGKPVTVAELTGNEKGGEALKAGAVRLYELLLELQGRRSDSPPETDAAKPTPGSSGAGAQNTAE